jgi:hypothetical protein
MSRTNKRRSNVVRRDRKGNENTTCSTDSRDRKQHSWRRCALWAILVVYPLWFAPNHCRKSARWDFHRDAEIGHENIWIWKDMRATKANNSGREERFVHTGIMRKNALVFHFTALLQAPHGMLSF